jgi:hypothetical protein
VPTIRGDLSTSLPGVRYTPALVGVPIPLAEGVPFTDGVPRATGGVPLAADVAPEGVPRTKGVPRLSDCDPPAAEGVPRLAEGVFITEGVPWGGE